MYMRNRRGPKTESCRTPISKSTVLRGNLHPFYIQKQTRGSKSLLKAEEELQNMLCNKTLELTDYLNKYSAQLVFDVLVIEDEVDMEDIDQVLPSGSAE